MITYTVNKNRPYNFVKDNIKYVLENLTPLISGIATSKKDHVLVDGSLHKSQWTHDNPHGYHWLKIQCYSDGKQIPGLSCVHIYMSFVNYDTFYMTIPNNIKGTDLPDVNVYGGEWVAVGITYSHS